MLDVVVVILTSLISILPASPFISVLASLDKVDALGFLNWFIPFDVCCFILEAWGIAMGVYLAYKTLRQNIEKII